MLTVLKIIRMLFVKESSTLLKMFRLRKVLFFTFRAFTG